MKKIVLAAAVFMSSLALFSCSGNKEESSKKETTDLKDSLPNPAPSAGHFWWEAQLNMGPKMIMNQKDELPADSLNVASVLRRMNGYYSEIRVEEMKQYSDTLVVKIPKSKYLTEQMGSSGAQAYLAELTYNLTEIPGIHFVTILFKAGDHASPDTYQRKDFENGGY